MFDIINNPEYDTFGEKGFGMLAQEYLSPKAIIEAKIQSRVAEFLGLKEKLLRLKLSKDPNIAKKADILLISQRVIESDLEESQPIITKVKQGLYSFGDMAKLTKLGAVMEYHIQNAKKLIGKVKFLPGLPGFFDTISLKTLLIIGGGLLTLIILRRR